MSVSSEDAPNEPEYVELHFESGNRISVAQVANLRSPENGGTCAVASQTLGAADRTTPQNDGARSDTAALKFPAQPFHARQGKAKQRGGCTGIRNRCGGGPKAKGVIRISRYEIPNGDCWVKPFAT